MPPLGEDDLWEHTKLINTQYKIQNLIVLPSLGEDDLREHPQVRSHGLVSEGWTIGLLHDMVIMQR